MLEDLVGKVLNVTIHEGGGLLDRSGMTFRGKVVKVQAIRGPPEKPHAVAWLEFEEPIEDSLRGLYCTVQPRYVGYTLEEVLHEQEVTVNVLLYGKEIVGAPDAVLIRHDLGGAIGTVEPLYSPSPEELLRRRIKAVEDLGLNGKYSHRVRLKAKGRLIAMADDQTRPPWFRDLAREAARRVENALVQDESLRPA